MAALSFTSCQKEEKASSQKFFASFEQAGNGKVSLDQNLNMYWDENDNSSMILVTTFGEDGESDHCSTYFPSSISADGKTAVLEYSDLWGYLPFPGGIQGPFYAATDAISWIDMSLNSDGSLHLDEVYSTEIGGYCVSHFMPMVARADNFGQLNFKHITGVLKMFVNLPEGYEIENVAIFNSDATATTFQAWPQSCDVAWDAQGEITLSNVTYYEADDEPGDWMNLYAEVGNGFYYQSLPVGDLGGLAFVVYAYDEDGNSVTFRKDMRPTASIHIERAGISTLTLTYTVDDIL